jgi:signal transduction histidine kinase
MRERVAQTGGTLEITGHRGKGTMLVVRIDLLSPLPRTTKAERHSG